MSEFCIRLCQTLLRVEIALTLGSVLVLGILRYFPIASPRSQRVLYTLVLLQGCLWFRIPLTIPTIQLIPQSSSERYQLDANDDLDDSLSPLLAEWLERSFVTCDPHESPPRMLATVAMTVVFVWLSGVMVILIVSFRNYRRFLSRLSIQREVPSDWIDEWNELLRALRVHQPVSFVVTKDHGPLLCWKPGGYQLIVPEELWAKFTSTQRVLILRHELAHLRRSDLWMSFGCHVIAIVHWMNPAVWLLVRRFDHAAEIACDEEVQKTAPNESCQYARTLLCLGSGQSDVLFASLANGRHGLAERIRRLTSSNPRKDSNMKKLSIVTLLVGITFANLLQIQSQGEDAVPGAKKTDVPKFGGFNPVSQPGDLQIHSGNINLSAPAAGQRTDAVVSVHEVLKGLKEFQSKKEQLKTEINNLGEQTQKLNADLQDKVSRAKGELEWNSIEK